MEVVWNCSSDIADYQSVQQDMGSIYWNSGTIYFLYFGNVMKMEKVHLDEIAEYLFLDLEWNQAPGTVGVSGREAIQIGVVAADEE